jgi:hypothetical protein
MVKKKSTWSDLSHVILYSAIAAVVLYAGWAISVAYQNNTMPTKRIATPNPSEPIIACTADAKICPDGSSVGRKGPACQFEACPVRK